MVSFMFCILWREDYRMRGKEASGRRVPILCGRQGDAAIEERSFVAKNAPLDDGQMRGSMSVVTIVTIKRYAMRTASPPPKAGRMGHPDIQRQRRNRVRRWKQIPRCARDDNAL